MLYYRSLQWCSPEDDPEDPSIEARGTGEGEGEEGCEAQGHGNDSTIVRCVNPQLLSVRTRHSNRKGRHRVERREWAEGSEAMGEAMGEGVGRRIVRYWGVGLYTTFQI